MGEPLVTVVIPTYNCAGTIQQALESALAQEVALEIIVIDDGSEDETAGIMESYTVKPDVYYVRNEKNCGSAVSRNRGVSMARGKYIAFLDADDWWDEKKLKKQLAALQKSGCVLCASARELVTADGKEKGRVIPVKEEISYRDLLRQNCINCSSVLARTEVLREFPMEHEEAHEDYITWLRILKKYGRACAVNEPLLKYRLTADGKSGSKLKSAKMTFRVYRFLGFGKLRSVLCFCSYALYGVEKYAAGYLRGISSHSGRKYR